MVTMRIAPINLKFFIIKKRKEKKFFIIIITHILQFVLDGSCTHQHQILHTQQKCSVSLIISQLFAALPAGISAPSFP